jgi:CDP-diacylglycerol--serine O-phosphatidyltransferase
MPKLSKIIIPNAITSLNLLSGAVAVVLAIQGEVRTAGILILIASVFDFFDGFVARKINAMSEFGKQLDSLADLISFGMAPAAIMYELLRFGQKLYGNFFQQTTLNTIVLSASFLIVLLSAIRLAKFNISENQKNSFMGLPTPAFAILVASFPLISSLEPDSFVWFNILSGLTGVEFPFKAIMGLLGFQIMVIEKTYFLLPVTLIFSGLLVSNIHMFSLKFQSMKFRDNTLRYRFLIFSGILIIFLQSIAIPIIIITYVIISVSTARLNRYRYIKAKRNMEFFLKT